MTHGIFMCITCLFMCIACLFMCIACLCLSSCAACLCIHVYRMSKCVVHEPSMNLRERELCVSCWLHVYVYRPVPHVYVFMCIACLSVSYSFPQVHGRLRCRRLARTGLLVMPWENHSLKDASQVDLSLSMVLTSLYQITTSWWCCDKALWSFHMPFA